MKVRFQTRFQRKSDNCLRNTISNSGDRDFIMHLVQLTLGIDSGVYST